MAADPTSNEAPYPELFSFFASLPTNARILDVGCGTGRNALYLARLGHRVVAVDSDATAIASLSKRATEESLVIHTLAADMRALPVDGPFDLILLDRVLHYLEDDNEQRAALAKLFDLLGPNGMLCAVFVSSTDESCQSLSSFVSLFQSNWKPQLDSPVTHTVPGAGVFTFHAQVWQKQQEFRYDRQCLPVSHSPGI